MFSTYNLPINSVSFGQVSTSILRYLHQNNSDVSIFPIGNIDFSSQTKLPESFENWISKALNKAILSHKRTNKIFKLWHLNGSLESFSNNQILYSFYELDQPTKVELNTVKNNEKVLFSSKYTVDLFKSLGCDNVDFVPLYFDKYNFEKIDKNFFSDERITFNLVGKLEKRKHHLKVLKAWAKKYGNDRRYFLQCSIFNPFMQPEDQTRIIASALEGKPYYNIQFLNYMPNNLMYNDYLNSANIIIGMSGGEGWGLPEFHSVAMGKYGVIMNAHGYKSWANESNSILVNPSSKIEAEDGLFFRKNIPYNQGSIFDFSEDDFISATELAISKYNKNPINENGLKLQQQFSLESFIKNISSYV